MPKTNEKVRLWNQYKLLNSSQDLLTVVADHDLQPFSSEAAATAVNRPKQSIGRSLKLLRDKGLIENISSHKGRFNWKLTAEGWAVIKVIRGE